MAPDWPHWLIMGPLCSYAVFVVLTVRMEQHAALFVLSHLTELPHQNGFFDGCVKRALLWLPCCGFFYQMLVKGTILIPEGCRGITVYAVLVSSILHTGPSKLTHITKRKTTVNKQGTGVPPEDLVLRSLKILLRYLGKLITSQIPRLLGPGYFIRTYIF